MANNGNRIWRFKKVDILFVVGLGVIVYGAVTKDVAMILAGTGVTGIPLSSRGDKGA